MVDQNARISNESVPAIEDVRWRVAPAEDRCCMGWPLGGEIAGPDLRCWNAIPGEDIWCPTCRANVDHDGPECECPGCVMARHWGAAMAAQRGGRIAPSEER